MMSEQRSAPDLLRQAGPYVRPAFFAAFLFIISGGRFDTFNAYGVIEYVATSILLILAIFEIIDSAYSDGPEAARFFWLGVWIMVAARVGIQATGAIVSPLYPLAYLFFGVLAGAVSAGFAALIWLSFMLMEAGWLLWSGGGVGGWPVLARHGAYLAAFGFAMGAFIHFERRQRLRAGQVLDKLKRDASEFQRDDTAFRLAGLTEGGRKKQALRSVFALDQAFYGALESCREMLGADTCALYWSRGPGEPLHLREIASVHDEIDPETMVTPGQGLLGWVVQEGAPLRVSGYERLVRALPYYKPGLKPEHLAAAPVVNGNRALGVLACDKLSGHEFSRHDEKLMAVMAGQVSEIHAHALLMKRTEAEAQQFKSLAELSHRLSGTLDLSEICEAVLKTGQAVANYDAAALVLPNGAGLHVVAAMKGELSEQSVGKPADLHESLAGWSLKEKQPLMIGDLASRTRKTPVLGKGLDPQGMRAVMVHPLPLRSAPGALAFFSKTPDGFGRFVARVSGILADLAAVSIHNALLYNDMEKKAITDGLTGLYNHRWFQERLADEIERAGRLNTRVAIVIADLDHFKQINDTFGHPAGDEVLKAVGGLLKDSVRKVDSAARYGGEEFVLILVGSDAKGAKELSERIRKKVSKLAFRADKKEFSATLSLGIAVYPDDAGQKQDLIELADRALYKAKQSGRNQSVLASAV